MKKAKKLPHTSFEVVPKKGQSIKVFCGRNVEPWHKDFKASRYGIVQHIITEEVKEVNKKTKEQKVIGTIEIAYIKECPPITTFDVDFFFDEKRVYFVQPVMDIPAPKLEIELIETI
jgi:hypothetical protein